MKRLFFTLLCFLLIAGNCLAASSRILPASYTEYTYDSAGGGEDYTSLATWEADTDTDLVTGTSGYVLTCSSGVHNDSVTIAGAITNSSYFRVIRAAEEARGTPTSGVRFLKTGFTGNIISGAETYVGIYGIAVSGTGVSVITGIIVSSSFAKVVDCTAYNITCFSGTSQIARGIASTASNTYIINCYATGIKDNWVYYGAFSFSSGSGTGYFYSYNNTGTNNDTTFYADGNSGISHVYLKNCIYSNKDIFGTSYFYETTNATSGVTFAADGYHLASNDTGAIGNGTDLSGDGTYAFDDDIDGETRSDWDIGADEYVASGARRRVIMVND